MMAITTNNSTSVKPVLGATGLRNICQDLVRKGRRRRNFSTVSTTKVKKHLAIDKDQSCDFVGFAPGLHGNFTSWSGLPGHPFSQSTPPDRP
jgi:hypothetical protein